MTDRPIIFSAPMVQALLAGRKTQTRRILKPQPELFEISPGVLCEIYPLQVEGEDCPRVALGRRTSGVLTTQKIRFAVGDRLYVRESIKRAETDQGQGFWTYAADHKNVWPLTKWYHQRNSLPSIHMPRWASRLTLTVTDVRVERLHQISRGDAMSEGCPFANMQDGPDPRDWFATLWNNINGPDAWETNPWVVAISFDVRKGNIDA